jgi:hypothetical protein
VLLTSRGKEEIDPGNWNDRNQKAKWSLSGLGTYF